MNKLIRIEVAYASVLKQVIIPLEIEENATILTAILQSGVLKEFPEINLEKNKVGIFSQAKQLTDLIKEGDRIEIYRPLIIDPKEARRAKAKNKAKN